MGISRRNTANAAGLAWSMLALPSCGGSTFSADEPGKAPTGDASADGRSSADAAAPEPDTGADGSSLQDRGADGDGVVDVAHDAAPADEPGGPVDATIDELRPADAPSEVRPADAGLLYRTAVLADGPVAYWRMGIASGSVVPDESGRRNDLVLQGSGHAFGVPGAVAGDDDRAIRFDGSNSYAMAIRPRDLDFPASAPFTIECWARRESIADGGTGSYFQHLVSAAAGGPPNRNGYLLYVLPSDVDPNVIHTAFEYDAPDMGQIGVEGPLAPLSMYAYYVATFDGTKVSLYIDGTLASSRAVNGSIGPRTSEFVVGRESSTGRYHFAGALDEIAVYDKALSTLRIIAHRDLALRR